MKNPVNGQYLVGLPVIIRNLTSRPELNGVDATIVTNYDPSTDRIGVHTIVENETMGFNLRLQNIEFRNSFVSAPIDTPTVKHMRYLAEKAEELYEIVSNDVGIQHEGGEVPPTVWIYNQTAFRKSFENYTNRLSGLSLSISRIMQNNCWYDYFHFMYTSYPPGFGDALKEAYITNATFDAAELFERLGGMNKNDDDIQVTNI
jgi:hypothetical protein